MKRLTLGTAIQAVVAVAVILILTYLPISGSVKAIAFQAMILIGLAVTCNIIGGFAGQLHLGHGAFFGVGAYAAAWMMSEFGDASPIMPWFAILLGGVAGLILTVIIIPCFRAQGGYFAILTLALTLILGQLAQTYAPGANSGLFFSSFDPRSVAAWAAPVFVTALCIWCAWFATRGKFGRGMAAVRQDPDAARGIGVNVLAVRTKAMMLSGGLCGLVGGVYALNLGFLDPATAFNLEWSILPLLALVLGGRATLVGPILGAILWVALDNAAASTGLSAGFSFAFQGLILLIIAMLVPKGIWGLLRDRIWKRTRPGPIPEPLRATEGSLG